MSQELFVRAEGGVGRLTLNRPEALGALTLAMCQQMIAALVAWRDDPAIRLVLIDHAGERGFCAGGDIRNLAAGHAGDGSPPRNFFFTEYRLDHLLFTYDKPVVTVMDGVVMGGGVGISLPAGVRIATERTVFAMPETGIGLFPDVGAGWFLPRLPYGAGYWLGLTGSRVKAADCLELGIATNFVPVANLEELKAALCETPHDLSGVLERFKGYAGPPPVKANASEMHDAFHADTVEKVLHNLAKRGSDWSMTQWVAIKAKSPLMTKVAWRQLKSAVLNNTFAEALAMEYRIAVRAVPGPDFTEGVRAAILDRDNKPAWAPASLEEVTEAMVQRFFDPLAPGEEWTPIE